jgi:DNA-binding transcriptional ArsR family regulator
MAAQVSLTDIAGLIGDSARSDMLLALLPGQALTAGELSMIAGISAQNASGHLQKLLEGRLVAIEPQGRHRYYRLATPEVAHALESLAAVSANGTFRRDESAHLNEIRFCRTCYDHLAGRVAVEITASLLKQRFIRERARDFIIMPAGERFLASWGIDVRSLRSLRRSLARRCLDWTERRPHISGALGAAMLQRCRELKWIAPIRGSRAVRLTTAGERHLSRQFAVATFSRVVGASFRN